MRTCLNLGACVKSSFIVYHSYSLIDAVWQKQPKVYSLFLPRGTRQVNPAQLSLKTVFQCATVWLISGYSHCGFIKSFFYNVLSCKPNWPPFKSAWARLKSYPFKTGLQCKLDQITRFHLFSCWKIIISIDLLQLLSFISFRAFYNISISLSLSLCPYLYLARALGGASEGHRRARAHSSPSLCFNDKPLHPISEQDAPSNCNPGQSPHGGGGPHANVLARETQRFIHLLPEREVS